MKTIAKGKMVLVLNSLLQYLIIFGVVTQLVQCQSDKKCNEKGDCKFVCKDVPGYSGDVNIDLSSLDSSSDRPKFPDIKDSQGREFTYEWNPCTTFTSGSCHNVNACQKTNQDEYSLGSVLVLLYSPQSKQFVMRYFDGAEGREMKVILIYERGENGRVSKVNEARSGEYTMQLYTKYAPHQGSSGGSSSDDSGGGISVGTVLVIIFFSILILYLGIGIAFLKYRRGAQGKDMIPNYEFWSKMPGLIKDGCIFSGRKTKECVSHTKERTTRPKSGEQSEGYEEIKDSPE